MRRLLTVLIPLAVLGLAYVAGVGQADLYANREARTLTIRSDALAGFSLQAAGTTKVDALTFLRGAELTGSDADFGGVSAFRHLRDRRFVAITDTGDWISGDINPGEGPVSLRNARIGPVLIEGGKRAKDVGLWDIESLAVSADGRRMAVGIEREHSVLVFEGSGTPWTLAGRSVPLPTFVRAWPQNRGIEALGFLPDGSVYAGHLIGLSERSGLADAATEGFVMKPDGSDAFPIRLRRRDGFDVTDLDFLPNGDMVVLERFFSPLKGVGMQLRRISHASIKPGADLDGEVLVSVIRGLMENTFAIDNMEGLSIQPDGPGRARITVVSDNNFSIAQRTLYLEFSYQP